MDQREVELRAQSGENSQLFMESQFTAGQGGSVQMMNNRFGGPDGFPEGDPDYDYDLADPDAAAAQRKITVNLEDAVLEEQKLFQILEVSSRPCLLTKWLCVEPA